MLQDFMRMSSAVLWLTLAPALVSCGGAGPSEVQMHSLQPLPVLFTNLASGYSTSDVHDGQDHVVRFAGGALIWMDGTGFPGFPVYLDASYSGGEVGHLNEYYDVTFGTKDGERHAYLSFFDADHPGTEFLIDIEIVDGRPILTRTSAPVPGT